MATRTDPAATVAATDNPASRELPVPRSFKFTHQVLVGLVAPLAPQAWWSDAVEKVAVDIDYSLKIPASCLAIATPRALDYVRTAPVLALAANAMIKREYGGASDVLNRFTRLVDAGAKLPVVMREMGTAPQLRALCAWPLSATHDRVVAQLATLHPSTIAQIIPKTAAEQQIWLTRLARWTSHAARRFSDDSLQFEWAARNLAGVRRDEAEFIADVVDLIGQDPAQFNLRWSFGKGLQHALRWHEELKSGKQADGFRQRYKVDFEQPLDIGLFPLERVEADITFLALRSGKELFDEGVEMHHCVASYFADVVGGRSRIYSLRTGKDRIATLEICGTTGNLLQIKGSRNAHVPGNVLKAACSFVRGVRDHLRAGLPERIDA